MASIGGYIVHTLDKLPEPPGHQTVETQRPGVDGVSARTEGWRAPVTTVNTRTRLTASGQIKTLPEAYAALKGSLVTIVDDHGNSIYDVMVKDVRVLRVQRVGVSTPPAYAILDCQWELYRWL